MKVFCALLVLLAVIHGSQCRTKVVERVNNRTPFQLRKRANVTPSIVGGRPAEIADFPYHLGMIEVGWGYVCGASNIHPRWALSAAHCLEFDTPPNEISLIGGSTSRLHGHTTFFVENYFLHPTYSTWTLNNDVALILVHANSPLTGPPHVTAIPLSGNCGGACCDVCVAGNPITVVGWGADDSGHAPENLLQVQKPIHDHANCNSIWGGGITTSMFCTVVENGIDSCQGDSGGAIIRNGIQVGIVSFGTAVCGDGTAPAVYARVEVPVIRDWIRTVSGV